MYEILILALIGIDQLTKWLVRTSLSSSRSIEIIGGFFNLTYLENRGAAFGLLQNMKVFFVAVALIVAIVGLVYIHKSKSKDKSRSKKDIRIARINRLAVSTIIGGAIGNLIDRLWLGYVVDFFDFRFIWSYVFNFADILVVVGTLVFCISMFLLGEDVD
ncbi:signal peptidase II [Peptostreptococcus sp.]|uniref:signal peptidase II n=1 Tax=Peptostreptococcus sp. TaxID=1262 RepID=UPI001CB2C2C3|nr:signal peptidase II [Peptostreptococcus sp.]MBF1050080.1 signal peptidase II [Peptostreptococcus sp.]